MWLAQAMQHAGVLGLGPSMQLFELGKYQIKRQLLLRYKMLTEWTNPPHEGTIHRRR